MENGIKFRTRFDIVVVPNGNLLIGDVFTGYTREQKNVQNCYEGGTMIGVKWRFFGTEPFDVTTITQNEFFLN